MNHPNRNWKRRWSVDWTLWRAMHQSGFEARFHRAPDGAVRLEFQHEEQAAAFYVAAGERRPDLRIQRLRREAQMLYDRAFGAGELPPGFMPCGAVKTADEL